MVVIYEVKENVLLPFRRTGHWGRCRHCPEGLNANTPSGVFAESGGAERGNCIVVFVLRTEELPFEDRRIGILVDPSQEFFRHPLHGSRFGKSSSSPSLMFTCLVHIRPMASSGSRRHGHRRNMGVVSCLRFIRDVLPTPPPAFLWKRLSASPGRSPCRHGPRAGAAGASETIKNVGVPMGLTLSGWRP